MRIIGLAGWSGSGKTTLVTKVIPRLIARGVRVSTLKHAHHGFDLDQPGKDSFFHRAAGATEVHMRIAAPPTTHSCFYGVDTPEREKLLAYQYDLAGMAKYIGVDSLAFISLDGLYRAVGEKGRNAAQPQYCDACFTGDYPIPLIDRDGGGAPRQLSLLSETA